MTGFTRGEGFGIPIVEGEFGGKLYPEAAALLRAYFERSDRAEWIAQIRQRYGLVTIDGGMPRQPCGMTADGSYEGWYMAERGHGDTPAVWRRRNPPDPLEGLTDWQKLGYWNEMSLRESRPFYAPDPEFERLTRLVQQNMRGEEVRGE